MYLQDVVSSNKIRRGLENSIKKLFPNFMEKLSSIIKVHMYLFDFSGVPLHKWDPLFMAAVLIPQ